MHGAIVAAAIAAIVEATTRRLRTLIKANNMVTI